MANTTIELRGEAKRLKIPEYRKMSATELKAAVEKARGGADKSAPAKPAIAKASEPKKPPAKKTAAKVKDAPDKEKAPVSAKKAPGKKTAPKSVKSVPAEESAKSGKAKRQTTDAKKPVASNKKTKVTKSVTTKPKAESKKAAPKAEKTELPGRNLIDNKTIDWTLDWTGGKTGNRAIIFKAIKKYKGNVAKVYEDLESEAKTMYPKSSRTGERYKVQKSKDLLRWHISRIKYDYVLATAQHQVSTNRLGYGEKNGKAPKATAAPKSARLAKVTPKPVSNGKKAQKGSSKSTAGKRKKAKA